MSSKNMRLFEILGASEIYDCKTIKEPGSGMYEREGTIDGISGGKLWVQWFPSNKHTWIKLDNCHHDSYKMSGYYVPALKEYEEELNEED